MIANWTTDQNVDAAHHAVRDVLPRVRALLPDVRLRLVGRGPERIADLVGAEGVDVVGPVAAVDTELMAASVVVVPMRYGGGTRLKVLEALAHGVPTVSTTLGCEGTDTQDMEHLLIRDDPDDFATAVHEVVTDHALAERLAVAGRLHYERRFRPEVAVDAITALADRVLARDTAQRADR
jgi:glycosyltransferase involved in cell wall biosynthesis